MAVQNYSCGKHLFIVLLLLTLGSRGANVFVCTDFIANGSQCNFVWNL